MRLLPTSDWRAMMLIPPVEKRAYLEPRKEKEKTVTQQETVFITVTVNQNFTEHIFTTVFSTIFSTISIPMTINHTVTASTISTAQVTLSPSPTTIPRVAPQLIPLSSMSNGETHVPLTPREFNPAPSATPVTAPLMPSQGKHSLSTTQVLAIVLGSLTFLGVLIAGLLFARRMYKKYRQQRVMRKQAQTEGNEMAKHIEPASVKYDETDPYAGLQRQDAAGSRLTDFYSAHLPPNNNRKRCEEIGLQRSAKQSSGKNCHWETVHHRTRLEAQTDGL